MTPTEATGPASSPCCSRPVPAPPDGAVYIVRDAARPDGRAYRRTRFYRQRPAAEAYAERLRAQGVPSAVFEARVTWRRVR